MFGTICYRLSSLYYKYPVVAIVGTQTCIHFLLANHTCFHSPLSSLAVKASLQTSPNHWLSPLNPQELRLTHTAYHMSPQGRNTYPWPAWVSHTGDNPYFLFMCFPCFPSHSNASSPSYYSLTLTVVQVHAVTLRPECKSARNTKACTFAYIRPYILGECNISALDCQWEMHFG